MITDEKDLIPFTTSKLPTGKWLVFAPHADDETFGMGGTLLLARKQNISITLVIMTDGNKDVSNENNEFMCQSRKLEAQQVADVLTLDKILFLDEKERGLDLNEELIAKLENIIQVEKPDQLFIPSAMEFHPDHRMTSELVCLAMNNLAIKADLYCYEISVQSQINLLIDISSVIEEKKSLLSLYKTQNNVRDVVLALNKARTYTLPAEVHYAEGFTQLNLRKQGTLSDHLYKQLLPFWQTKNTGELPLVSVIIRTKDRPELLQRAVQSVIQQIYANIELLVINDGGCDVGLDEATIKNSLTQFQLINLEQNLGRAAAANIGLQKFHGDYAMFLDDDDTIDSNHIIQLLRVIQKNNADVAYSGVRTDDGQLFNHQYDRYNLYAGNYIPIHAVIFSKKIVQSDCSFDERFSVYEDWDFWLQLSQKTDFYHSESVTATYFSSGNSGGGIKGDPSIRYNFRLEIYKKWGKIWTPEVLNQIFLSMYNRFQEKSRLLDFSLTAQSKQEEVLKNKSVHIGNLEDNGKHFRAENKRLQEQSSNQTAELQKNKISQQLSHTHIHYLEQQVKEKDTRLKEKDSRLKEKDTRLKEKDSQLKEKVANIHHLQQKLQSSGCIANLKKMPRYIKRRLVTLILTEPKLRFIAHAREYFRHYPGGFSRGFNMLKTKGIKAAFSRVMFLLNHNVASTQTADNQSNDGKIYQYQELQFTPDIAKEIEVFEYSPLISIIMPVYNVETKWLEKAIDSVKQQWYEHWELCIVDDASDNEETLLYLKQINHPKIQIKFLQKNGNISVASNHGLAMASGEFIALMDNDDEITADALYEVVKDISNNQSEFIYSDEDKIASAGEFCQPHFKADYSPDLILSQNYMSHFGVIKKSLVDQVDGFTEGLEGAQDYDLYLKILEKTNRISHISKVLYHWRQIPGSTASVFGDKSYAHEAGKKALVNAMQRRQIDAEVEDGKFPGTYRVKQSLRNSPLISIVIPFKDKPELLELCITSILDKSSYKNFEIIGVSNNSEEKVTFDMMKYLSGLDNRVSFYEYDVPFNYSEINNYAVKKFAKGEYVVLLNNDIEIISSDWIEELLSFAQRKNVGAVGAKLLYPNDTIQHAGVILGIGGVAGHSHKYFPKDANGYFSRLQLVQNVSAVTAACLMLSKEKYWEVGGLNEEQLSIAFNDVDFCLRLREKNYLNIYSPFCEAYHHESISRGAESTPDKQRRFQAEVNYMIETYGKLLMNDPYYNKNLTLKQENFSLKQSQNKIDQV